MAEDDVQGPTTDTDNGAAEPVISTTPWAQYLEPLPESVRPLVEPAFREWDAATTQRFQKYSQQLEPYKAWDDTIEQFGDPQVAQQAFALMQALNDDPAKVYQAIAENYGFGDQGNAEPEYPDENAPYVDPEFASVKQMTEAMAQIMLADQQARDEANEDAELDEHLSTLTEAHGEFDQEYVLGLMQIGYSGEQAVEKYLAVMGQIQQRVTGPPAPTILGSGGGLPSEAVDPASMSSKDTKALVAQMLAQASQT